MRKNPPIEQERLLAHVLRKPREWILSHPEVQLTPAQRRRYSALLRRLARGEPLAHLIGEWWFYGRPFTVNRSVLIPRPETELMIEIALDRITNHGIPNSTASFRSFTRRKRFQILDIGTGSGCIAITLAKELPNARITAIDTSHAALRVARTNARHHEVSNRITFLRGNLLKPILDLPTPSRSPSRREGEKDKGPQFIVHYSSLIICANLPYLTTAEWRALPASLKQYEPRLALDGGPDGLTPFRKLLTQVSKIPIIRNSLFIILEVDPRRKRALTALTRRHLPRWEASWHRDLAGRWRVLALNSMA
ncbi:MAG: peptide chain release factor N(5)-glutamine methyltransferase [Candidatus Peregrinibacteria bacterium]|nr:peptide chain release factor N(5)-glutamine methyltransferase [Candidatus Peregrinibacteria bacterium]